MSVPRQALALNLNGAVQDLTVEPRETLLDVLRDRLCLTGTKSVCERGHCGACTVLVDGEPRYACLVLAVDADDRQITTIEGLAADDCLHPVQQAFIETDALQCGYCTPGQVLSVVALLKRNPDPSETDIIRAISGNLCRCGAYRNIVAAARRAAEADGGEGA